MLWAAVRGLLSGYFKWFMKDSRIGIIRKRINCCCKAGPKKSYRWCERTSIPRVKWPQLPIYKAMYRGLWTHLYKTSRGPPCGVLFSSKTKVPSQIETIFHVFSKNRSKIITRNHSNSPTGDVLSFFFEGAFEAGCEINEIFGYIIVTFNHGSARISSITPTEV